MSQADLEKWERKWRGMEPLGNNLIVYRGMSDIHHEDVMRRGLLPSPGQEKVYTATRFGEALRFAYGHAKDEGGNPIVYELEVPVERFESQIVYHIDAKWHPMGFLTSKSLEPELIKDVIRIPIDADKEFQLVLRKEGEEKEREAQLNRLLAKIPEERY